jgi:hypothetical protein
MKTPGELFDNLKDALARVQHPGASAWYIAVVSLTDEDKNWMLAQLERVETALLTEFHKWSSPVLPCD